MSVSLWQRRSCECVQCDLVIIGGGIAGLSAAIEAGRRGLRAVVLERGVPGSGASGRNAGFLMRGVADNYAVAARAWGRDRAQALWRFNEENIEELRAMGITGLPSYAARPSCLIAVDENEEAELRESAALLHDDGFAVGLAEAGSISDTLWARARPRVGLINPNDAVINPVELLDLLRAHVPEGVLRCGQEVFAIEPALRGLRVQSSSLSVEAGEVLVCLNAFAGNVLPELADVVKPNRGQMLALRPTSQVSLRFAYYVNRGGEYLREGPDGLVIIGGARRHFEEAERSLVDEPNVDVQRRIEQYARSWIADDYEVVARWAGIMGFSPDGLPLVGQIRPGVWFCGGFTGHGMSMAQKTARTAVAAIVEGTASLFDIARLGRAAVSAPGN
jgi:glycine/D-amino acid oxidase-like deaminating enzyme